MDYVVTNLDITVDVGIHISHSQSDPAEKYLQFGFIPPVKNPTVTFINEAKQHKTVSLLSSQAEVIGSLFVLSVHK